jgi:hypothetical protein
MTDIIPILVEKDKNNRSLLALCLYRHRITVRSRNDISNTALCTPDKSSWVFLDKSSSDESFLNIVGLNRSGFDRLFRKFKRYYTFRFVGPRGGRPSKLSKRQALGMLLQFYASTSELKQIAQLHGLRKNTASRLLIKAEKALCLALRHDPLGSVKWPSKDKQREWGLLVNNKFPLIHGRFGFVDGKNYKVKKPSKIDLQNAMYNGWLHATLVTGVLCFGVDGCLIWGKHNCVGSWNDGDMSRDLQEKLLNDDIIERNHGLVSDTAFPVGQHLIGKIITPLKEGDLDRANPRAQLALITLSNSITSLRQACEWGVGSIEKVWRQLLVPLPFNQKTREIRLNNIFRLWILEQEQLILVKLKIISIMLNIFFK